jgi:hypothetical protein
MTSIAAASGNTYLTPLQQLQAELQSEVNSGAISSSDQAGLSSALTDINSSLQGGGAGASASGTNLPPGDLKSKIDNLIASEVSSGKLSSAQATELQGVFKAAFANGPGGTNPAAAAGAPDQAAGSPSAGATHHGHHGHHGGPPATDTSSSTDSTSGSSSTGSAADILQQFLKSLQSALSSSSSASYSASGTPDTSSASTTSASALLIDYQT